MWICYTNVEKLWHENSQRLSQLYLMLNVFILADMFEAFRENAGTFYELDFIACGFVY